MVAKDEEWGPLVAGMVPMLESILFIASAHPGSAMWPPGLSSTPPRSLWLYQQNHARIILYGARLAYLLFMFLRTMAPVPTCQSTLIVLKEISPPVEEVDGYFTANFGYRSWRVE